MSMFDSFLPRDAYNCPRCGKALTTWQGKDGPNGLFLWAQGSRAPIDQLVDDEVKLPAAERDAFTLPPTFVIYSYDCPAHQPINAQCRSTNGVWTDMVVLPGLTSRG